MESEIWGESSGDAFPEKLEPILHQVQEKLGDQPLKLLLSTDEPFVPWELAMLEKPLRPGNDLHFLGNQTHMGRWWMHNQVPAQPTQSLDIGHISALSGLYNLASRQVRLPEAEKEREHLVDTYQAVHLEADKATLDDLARQGNTEPTAGHLMHIALHGFSDPNASSSGLFLTTGEVFPASFLVGGYKPGETPPIAFCFLNACQVGTENTFLGQASGFPGVLLRNGAQGFMAPLWSVQDVLARELAEGFYARSLQQGKSLGEVLQSLRDAYEQNGNITPLAYVYYGHPGLKLHFFNPLDFLRMSATLIPLIVGALIGIVPSLINKYFDTRNEQKRWERERSFARQEKFQSQLSSTGKKLFSLQHAINWYVWLAYKSPEKLNSESLGAYDQEVKNLFPDILGELVEIAIISPSAYQYLDEVYKELVAIDADFAKQVSKHMEKGVLTDESTEVMGELFQRVILSREAVIDAVKGAIDRPQAA